MREVVSEVVARAARRARIRPADATGAAVDGVPSARQRPSIEVSHPRWRGVRHPPALWYPLTVWAAWRATHLALLVAFGGDPVAATFHSDGSWFRSVLEDGYVVTDPTYATHQNPAFLPGLPWLTWPLAQIAGGQTAALLVANLLGCAAFMAVHIATRTWFGERTARIATAGLALWPVSFVLWAYYSESLFIVATALALWADHHGRRATATLGCYLAALTRTVGIALAPVVAVARWRRLGRLDAGTVAYLAAGPAAVTTVAGAQHAQTGDALAWMHAQQPWGRGLSAPWTPVLSAAHDIAAKLPDPALELALNLAAIGLVALGAAVLLRWAHREHAPVSVAAWTFTAWLVPLGTTVVSSQVRFALGAWPALAAWSITGRHGRPIRVAAIVTGVALTVVFLARWADDAWVA